MKPLAGTKRIRYKVYIIIVTDKNYFRCMDWYKIFSDRRHLNVHIIYVNVQLKLNQKHYAYINILKLLKRKKKGYIYIYIYI